MCRIPSLDDSMRVARQKRSSSVIFCTGLARSLVPGRPSLLKAFKRCFKLGISVSGTRIPALGLLMSALPHGQRRNCDE
jgi:hypothetical protein